MQRQPPNPILKFQPARARSSTYTEASLLLSSKRTTAHLKQPFTTASRETAWGWNTVGVTRATCRAVRVWCRCRRCDVDAIGHLGHIIFITRVHGGRHVVVFASGRSGVKAPPLCRRKITVVFRRLAAITYFCTTRETKCSVVPGALVAKVWVGRFAPGVTAAASTSAVVNLSTL